MSGASTMFPGFSSRLETEVKTLYKEKILKDVTKELKININIIDTPRRKFSVFTGAAFLAKVYADNSSYWISKEDWDEVGPRIINDKCQNIII